MRNKRRFGRSYSAALQNDLRVRCRAGFCCGSHLLFLHARATFSIPVYESFCLHMVCDRTRCAAQAHILYCISCQVSPFVSSSYIRKQSNRLCGIFLSLFYACYRQNYSLLYRLRRQLYFNYRRISNTYNILKLSTGKKDHFKKTLITRFAPYRRRIAISVFLF